MSFCQVCIVFFAATAFLRACTRKQTKECVYSAAYTSLTCVRWRAAPSCGQTLRAISMLTHSAKSQKGTLPTARVCASGSSLVGCLDCYVCIVIARWIDL
ncbi:hypothetical protein TW95_gp0659 [Pandoravirus inopinatum]|uniref:Uncharacterized protein n=1 Tax=Pandoravirus inopinatum TaxID=1605721 RepID=A0A0B5IXB8_9VIRU|nr:hypothetical protein TW95_gp0659 [Pandoravirus inopinatum]AJF97393.1 hypothetical protein [Pandoravirus inopinatum]